MKHKCEYCGNKSGKTDRRGNCISCGATIETHEQYDFHEVFGVDQNYTAIMTTCVLIGSSFGLMEDE